MIQKSEQHEGRSFEKTSSKILVPLVPLTLKRHMLILYIYALCNMGYIRPVLWLEKGELI